MDDFKKETTLRHRDYDAPSRWARKKLNRAARRRLQDEDLGPVRWQPGPADTDEAGFTHVDPESGPLAIPGRAPFASLDVGYW